MEKNLREIKEAIEMKVLGYIGMFLIGLLSLGAQTMENLMGTNRKPKQA